MKTNLHDIFAAATGLIASIEDARERIEWEMSELGEAMLDVDSILRELADQARDLGRCLVAAHRSAPHLRNAIGTAAVEAIDNLVVLLQEARDSFAAGERPAAASALAMFDEHADDLRAALCWRSI